MLYIAATEMIASLRADVSVAVSRNTTRFYPWIRKVIPNGVDPSLFHPGTEREIEPTILFVGTYENRKRGRLLMEAFSKEILPALPNTNLWMVCSDAPAAPNVTVFGRVSDERIAELYRRAWVFCLPSSYEGFGVPYIEAMASGTPVVATPNAGSREVLDGGRAGILAKPDELGSALISLLRNEERREQLSREGLRRALNYGWDSIVTQYEQLYREVLAIRKSGLKEIAAAL
jgi:glycosyltransferase involved in cell wall biosynthesis